MGNRKTHRMITIDLHHQEFRLLQYLIQNAGRMVTRAMPREHVRDLIVDPRSNLVESHKSRHHKLHGIVDSRGEGAGSVLPDHSGEHQRPRLQASRLPRLIPAPSHSTKAVQAAGRIEYPETTELAYICTRGNQADNRGQVHGRIDRKKFGREIRCLRCGHGCA